MHQIAVLGISSSLRRDSHNTALLRAFATIAPESIELTIADLVDVPVYNADVEADGDPPAVKLLKHQIEQADALLFATTEYNGGIPGSLKNAIDWASREPNPIGGKPAAIIGGSGGRLSTAHAQLMLRHVLAYLGCPVMPRPTLMLAGVGSLFEDGQLVDEATRARLGRVAAALVAWVARVG